MRPQNSERPDVNGLNPTAREFFEPVFVNRGQDDLGKCLGGQGRTARLAVLQAEHPVGRGDVEGLPLAVPRPANELDVSGHRLTSEADSTAPPLRVYAPSSQPRRGLAGAADGPQLHRATHADAAADG